MAATIAGLAAFGVGLLAATALWWPRLTACRREAWSWKTKAGILVGALRPFAPVKVVHGRPHLANWFYWSCPGCNLLGGRVAVGKNEDPADINDDAREHFVDEHLTRENFARAGRALVEVLGERWWRR